MRLEQATIKDIARELQVSSSTVSRALKDYPGISDETKRKVKEMAEKLHYRPNAIALSLRKSRSFTIGVIIPEVVHFFFSTVTCFFFIRNSISFIWKISIRMGSVLVYCLRHHSIFHMKYGNLLLWNEILPVKGKSYFACYGNQEFIVIISNFIVTV